MTASFRFMCSSAIALNNIAVSLAQRNHGRTALQVFREAIHIVKGMSDVPPEDVLTPSQVRQCLDNAYNLVARSFAASQNEQNYRVLTLDQSLFQVGTLSTHERAVVGYQMVLVRMELEGHSLYDIQAVDEGSLEASVILYNMSCVHGQLARSAGNQSGPSWQAAYKLSQFCAATLRIITSQGQVLQGDHMEFSEEAEALSVLNWFNVWYIAHHTRQEGMAQHSARKIIEYQTRRQWKPYFQIQTSAAA